MTNTISNKPQWVRGTAATALCLFSLCFAPHAIAFECSNAGVAANTGDDGGSEFSVACGENSEATGSNSTALGWATEAINTNSTALGQQAKATGDDSTAIGRLSEASGSNSTALGENAKASGFDGTALGRFAESGEDVNNTAVGVAAKAGTVGNTGETGHTNTAVGAQAFAGQDPDEIFVKSPSGNTAVGFGAKAASFEATAIGKNATAVTASIAVGVNAESNARAIAIGHGALGQGFSSVVLGDSSSAIGDFSVAIGRQADAGNDVTGSETSRATAIGFGADARGTNSLAVGTEASITSLHTNATVIGHKAKVGQSNAMVLGSIPGVNTCDPNDASFPCDYVDVGIGTTTPAAPLHIQRTTSGVQEMFRFTNTGGSFITWEKESSNAKWFFTHEDASGGRLIMDHQFNDVANGPEFALSPDGDLEIKGTLTELSDENAKQDIAELDGALVLAKLAQVPVSQWAYKASPKSKHVGPMAQDFHAAFGLGKDDKHISPRDMVGVALAAIKALKSEHENAIDEKDAEIAALSEDRDTQKAEIDELRSSLKQVRQVVEGMKVRLETMEARHPMVQVSSR